MKLQELYRKIRAARAAVKRQRRSRRGMNLIEVVIVIAIILIIIGVLGFGASIIFSKSKVSTTKMEMRGLEQVITAEILLMGTQPTSLKDISGLKDGQLTDEWRNEYILEVPGPGNLEFDIVSYGADGMEGGTAEAADLRLSEFP